MDPNRRATSEPKVDVLDINTSPPATLADVDARNDEATPPSVSTAAWLEKTELQPQLTTEQIQPRATQEINAPKRKKQKMHDEKPEHDGPTAKQQKYDRQLRLWGANGQGALENAHVCLINSGFGAVGAETLKNLVLPGVGQFTIIDKKLVREEDLGVNFFLDQDCLDKPRGQCLVDMLCELNPDVNGHWQKELVDFTPYDIFIWVTPSADVMGRMELEKYCHQMQKTLITVNSQGFHAYFHVQFNGDFPIVETHPEETAIRDLRLLNPWPELAEWASKLTADLEEQTNHKHGHIPYLALILYYIEQWKEQHKMEDGKAAEFKATFAQKKEIQKLIQAGQRYDNGEGGEENYEQAIANIIKTVRPVSLSSSVREIFDLCDKPGYRDSPTVFWHMARALKAFYNKNGRLPLTGYVPDMKAESEVYVQLQNLYKAAARADVAEFKRFMPGFVLRQGGVEDEIMTFCKNAEFLHLIRHLRVSRDSFEERELHRKWAKEGLQTEARERVDVDAHNAECDAAQTPERHQQHKPPHEFVLLALRSVETYDDLVDVEEETIWGAVSDLLTEPTEGMESEQAMLLRESRMMQEVVREIARAQGGELHNTAALVGGLVSQEVIKVVTRQYVPLDNLVVWDGVFCRMGTFRA